MISDKRNQPTLLPAWLWIVVRVLVSYLAAGTVVWLLSARSGLNAAAAILIGTIFGSGITFGLLCTFRRLELTLDQLDQRQPIPASPPRFYGGLFRRIHALIGQASNVTRLRDDLLGQVQDSAAQQERNRLARDLHDSIKQQLFSISISAAAAEARLDSNAGGVRTAIQDIRRSTHEAMAEMNALLQQLAPSPLEKVGLQQALRDQAEALGYRTGAAVRVEFGLLPPDDCLPSGTQISLFRIAQEAFSNVARHARARHVGLSLGQDAPGSPLELRITDDGQGFDPAHSSGMGLQNIRARVAALGGTFTLQSQRGTSLLITIPVLAPPEIEGELMTVQPTSTLHRVFAAGLIGGLVLIAVLVYPAYFVLPGAYLADWPGASPLVGIVLQAVGLLAVVGLGYTAARFARADSRPASLIFGALAGALAAMILYAGLLSAVLGVVSNGEFLRQGIPTPSTEREGMANLIQSLLTTHWAAYLGALAALLAGVGLGAIGGLLAPLAPSRQPIPWATIRASLKVPLNGLFFVSGVGFIGLNIVYGLLEPSTQRILSEYNLSVAPVLLAGLSLLPLLLGSLCYLVSFGAVYLVLQSEARTDPLRSLWFTRPLATAITAALMSLPVPFVILFIQIPSPGAVVLVLIDLAIVGWLLYQIVRLCLNVRAQQQREGLVPAITREQVITSLLVILNLAAVIIGVPVLLASDTSIFLALIVLAIMASLAALLLIFNRRMTRRAQIQSQNRAQDELQGMFNGLLAFWSSLVLTGIAVIMPAFVMMLTTTAMIVDWLPPVLPVPERAMLTSRQVIEGVFQGQVTVLIWIAGAAAAMVGVPSLVSWGLTRVVMNRQRRTAPAEGEA